MKKMMNLLMVGLFVSSAGLVGSSVLAADKPKILKPCSQCHTVEENQIRGRLKSRSNKAETLQVFTGGQAWQLKFGNNTELNGAASIAKIGLNKEILVDYVQQGNELVAKTISVKQPASIPPKWILDVKAMEKLARKTPEEGNYALFDARPGKLFHEGHITGAVSSYDAQFDKNIKALPKDKNKLVVFYCGGLT